MSTSKSFKAAYFIAQDILAHFFLLFHVFFLLSSSDHVLRANLRSTVFYVASEVIFAAIIRWYQQEKKEWEGYFKMQRERVQKQRDHDG